MPIFTLLALQATDPEILVTASRLPVAASQIGVSATVIDARWIEALGEVQVTDLLRLVPGVAIATSGARGSQAQVRIRGAEANHSLLFIDGIKFNDPAGGNEPRFETLVADGVGRIEVVRGPQSALWGSEALGGVISLETPVAAPGISGLVEYGSRDSKRGSATLRLGGVTLTASRVESDGIDILGGGNGDRDGYGNTTVGLRAVLAPMSDGEIGIAARYIDAYSAFDGTDPLTFLRADTRDNSSTRTAAVRVHATLGTRADSPWSATLQGQYLGSRNRNRDGDTPLNRTSGDRLSISGQLARRIEAGITRHELIAGVEREDEGFASRDQQFFGSTNQDRTRGRTALIGEWKADWGLLSTDIAVRHDDFNRFADKTTLRASALASVGGGFALSAAYGEGIAQPTFFDLFGFFPGSFVGNPDLGPETSRGYELGARWSGARATVAVAAFDNRLRNEIVSVFDPATFLSSTANATGRSKRRGVEVTGAAEPLPGLRLSANYTYLKARDQQVAGDDRLREARRPTHSGSLAFDYEAGRVTLGGSLAYVGERRDTDFDILEDVTLGDYVLGSLRVAYRLSDALEAFGRVDNAFDADYEDVIGYATPGRAAYAGVRIRLGG